MGLWCPLQKYADYGAWSFLIDESRIIWWFQDKVVNLQRIFQKTAI